MILEFAVLLLFVAFWQISASANSCDLHYLKMHSQHSMCKQQNPTCDIFWKGLTQEDKDLIVKIHNQYRSRVATGNETLAGGLPSAANMLEMVWDDELAELAQKHAESCFYGHDCMECRALEQFMVGQNIGYRSMSTFPDNKIKDWSWFLAELYSEVSNFDKKLVQSYTDGGYDPKSQYGHFTQMIWSESWRVGCGWIYYNSVIGNSSYYLCNYGPAGNIIKAKVYQDGATCSSCPRNTCCGETCERYNITLKYEGLCKVIDETMAPSGIGERDSDTLFICDFQNQSDCSIIFRGKTDWKLIKSINGNWINTILKDGESAWMMMTTPFTNADGPFCFSLVLRSSAVDVRHPHGFGGEVMFIANDGEVLKYELSSAYQRQKFIPYVMDVKMHKNTEITIIVMLSVGKEVSPQFFDLKEISVRKDRCPVI